MDQIELDQLLEEIKPQIAEINRGAQMMDAETDEKKKLVGSSVVNKAVTKIIEKGGMPLLRAAFNKVDPERQRTVELQLFAVSDKTGATWLP
ncbi:hypothetical protein J7394_05780 [Ruegeria sp. R13_0]|jgi:hypothetical protein|uniref:hypothetical protein n=1 Tax=Ruegeria sp. R13_0 TaxID=2821099 RepID=UPI001ADC4092|nr:MULTISPECIES: hypothetical protein [unclassified Ruegeria]MBO9433705.1 hypothetical protein [Ruegeria sp. R13_0]MCX8954875.1 hypothetical protein [Ruegeria sp. NA]